MGHHFDSPESRADIRINITGNCAFHGGAPGSVAMILCCVAVLRKQHIREGTATAHLRACCASSARTTAARR